MPASEAVYLNWDEVEILSNSPVGRSVTRAAEALRCPKGFAPNAMLFMTMGNRSAMVPRLGGGRGFARMLENPGSECGSISGCCDAGVRVQFEDWFVAGAVAAASQQSRGIVRYAQNRPKTREIVTC